jgi:hypothetical protein
MGTHLDGLRKAVINDESWQELLRSPLMLRVACLTYLNTPYEALETAAGANLNDRRAAVFDAYIENMFATKTSTDSRYSKQATLRWISWLARTMQARSLSIFEIEQLQPTMLTSKRSRLFYCFASRLLGGSGFFIAVPDLVTSGLVATADNM